MNRQQTGRLGEELARRHLETLENERPIGERLLMQFYRAVTTAGTSSSAAICSPATPSG